MKINLYFLYILLVLPSFWVSNCDSREPIKEMYYIGAGGEPIGEKTIFDGSIKLIGKFINNSDWKTTISLDGGHATTEALISKQFDKARNLGPFKKENYEKLIKEMISKIESGQLGNGDQLMITIDTHGAKNKGEKTHDIALSSGSITNYETLLGVDTVNLDDLEKLIELANQKGIKLAVIDFSCYSGNLLNIKNDNICMISATSPDFPSWTGINETFFSTTTWSFSDKFINSLKKGKNLEDLFLTSMENSIAERPDFPMISSPEGQVIHAMLYDQLKPFLYNNSEFKDLYYSNQDKLENLICSLDQKHEDLKSILVQVASMKDIYTQLSDFKELNKALDQYRDYQKSYERALTLSKTIDSDFQKIIATDYPLEVENLKGATGSFFLRGDSEARINLYYPKDKRTNSESEKKFIKSMERNMQIKKEILAKLSPDKIALLKKMDDVEKDKDTASKLAGKISLEMKKAFSKMYRQNRKATSNPCRDFIL